MLPLALVRLLAGAALWLAAAVTFAQTLPPQTDAALRRAKLPTSALAAVVQDLQTGERRLVWNAQAAVNPASVFKLFTTYAALDKLGPAWTWRTPVYLSGPVRAGVLEGHLTVKGSGDPQLVLERLWLLMRRLQQMGIREIRGDIVLDNSAFALPDISPAEFDGDPSRPYNVRPDALLLNYKSITLSFLPDPARGLATVMVEPALAGVATDDTVPLAGGPCGDWRGALKASLADPGVMRYAGAYPTSCGEKSWPVAYADPRSYNARLLEQLWRELGGRLGGKVRSGLAPVGQAPAFELSSPRLAEVVRDINKFSNNVMAEQVFLTLGAQSTGAVSATQADAEGATMLPAASLPSPAPSTSDLANTAAVTSAPPPADGPAAHLPPGSVARPSPNGTELPRAEPGRPAPTTPQVARDALRRWVEERWGAFAARPLVVDNGSGLSRDSRVSADLLARLLQTAFNSPVMSELMSSLPVSGLDGTLRRSTATAGRAHLKTGSLRDVAAVAGYVLGNSGRRYAVVAILNHDNAGAGRPALDSVVQWAIDDAPVSMASATASPTPPPPASPSR